MKKRNNKKKILKEIYEEAVFFKTPGYDIDKYSVQYGRDHDEIKSDRPCRHSRKPNKCKRGKYCSIYFDK